MLAAPLIHKSAGVNSMKLLKQVMALTLACLLLIGTISIHVNAATEETTIPINKKDLSQKLESIIISNVDIVSTSFDEENNILTVYLSPDTVSGSTAIAQFSFEGNPNYNEYPNIGTLDPINAKEAAAEVNKLKGRIETILSSGRETEQRLYVYKQKKDIKSLVYTVFIIKYVISEYNDGPNPESVVSIEIATPPDRTEYFQGDYFSTSGMTIIATLNDGSKTQPYHACTYEPTRSLITTDEKITVSYGNASVEIPIMVRPLNVLLDAEIIGEGEFIYKPYLLKQYTKELSNIQMPVPIIEVGKGKIVVPFGTTSVTVELTVADASVQVYVDDQLQEKLESDPTKCRISIPASPLYSLSEDGNSATILRTQDDDGTVVSLRSEGCENQNYPLFAYTQSFDGLPDSVVDYLCIGSQYTNIGSATARYVGLNALSTLIGSTGQTMTYTLELSPCSIGNFGGYITYYYTNAIENDPKNPFGIDFIVYGNSYLPNISYYEPGNVLISEDGTTWYTLAGSLHYENDTVWDYQIVYINDEGVTKCSDNQGNSIRMKTPFPKQICYPLFDWSSISNDQIPLSGVKLGGEFPLFGYADRGQRAISNIADNPYTGSSETVDGFDLSWAVDENGLPIDVDSLEIHYVKIQAAWFTDATADIGEKSPEINMVRIAEPAQDSVGITDAPQSITIDGKPVYLVNGQTVYNSIPVSGPFFVDVTTASENTNVIINSKYTTSRYYDSIPSHEVIRVIVQEGEKAPWIGYFNLTQGENVPTYTLNFVDGNDTQTICYDDQMNGIALPVETNYLSKEFIGWQYGLSILTTFDSSILPDGATLYAVWKDAETPGEETDIDVSFRLVGSTKAASDINLANGGFNGAEYQTWISTTEYTVSSTDTVLDVLEAAATTAGLTVDNEGNYVKSITAPEALGGYKLAAFDNGQRSGWMFQIRHEGETEYHHGTNGVAQQHLADGDEIVFHYVNDYSYEVDDWDEIGGVGFPAMGDGTYYNGWLKIVDSVKLSESELTLTLTESETAELTAAISPTDAVYDKLTWESSNKAVATVENGKVTAVAEGTAIITAKAGGVTAACSVTVKEPDTVLVESVTLNKDELTLDVGASETLTATVKPDNATDKTVTWSSSDPSIATVKDGVVTGVKAGTATITAASGSKSATCSVKVSEPVIAVSKVTLDTDSAEVEVGRTVALIATVLPKNATDKTITWTSSDPSIATVKDGVITGMKEGTVTITATAGGESAKAAVKVVAQESEGLTYTVAKDTVLRYVKSVVTNPKVASEKGEWAVLALNRGGVATDAWNNIYLENLKTYLDKCGGILASKEYTEYSRVILALTSMGVDASQVVTENGRYNLVSPLLDKQANGRYQAEWQGNNGTAFALLALDSHDYLPGADGRAARAAFIESLLENRLDNGAWSISGASPSLDVTAAVVYALAPYYLDEAKLAALGGTVTYAELKEMVDGGLAYLSEKQNADGGFGSAEADVWTLIALSTLDRDAATDKDFVKENGSLLDDLLRYFDETTGGFKHDLSESVNQMASEQAAYGLVSYVRYKTEMNTLYDMRDVEISSLEEKANQAAADEVEEVIDAIGEVTLESKARIDSARAAYDALTDAQKALVENLATLTAAEDNYKSLAAKADQDVVDQKAAKGVEDLINAIGEVTLESEKAIKSARSAYDSLTDEQKKLVENLEVLEAAEKKLTELKENAEKLVTVKFHLRKGTSNEITDGEEKVYTKGDEGNDLPDASREGYEFQGWFDFPTDGTKYTKVSADLPEDLYAQWKSTSSGDGSSGSSEPKIKVSFRLIGAEKADKKVDLGSEEYMPDYVTWIATTTYEMDEGDTVYDLWVKALREHGLSSEGAESNYVKTVYAPASLGGYALSEFTNGPRSGWMYTLNGRHPGYGLEEQELHDGDRIIWHYVNDYAYEVPDWFDEGAWESLGDGRYYSRWLKAPDRLGGAGGGLGEGAKASSSGGGNGSSGSDEVTDLIPSYDGDTVWISSEVDHSEGGMAYAADAELTKDIVTKGLEKAEDKSKLKLWVDIQDSNRLVLQVDPDAMEEISDAGAGLRLQCSKGVIELDAETVAQLAESGRQVRVTVSYDDWNENTKVSVGAFPPKDTDTPVTMKIELPVTKDGQALSIVNSDGSRTPIKKSAIIGDRAYAEVTGAVTLEITDIQKYWNDVKEKDWFADAVQFAVSHELMNGVDRYEFAPNAPMTRAMLVTVLYRLEDEPEITGSGDGFGDVDAKGWYAEAVTWASENGLVNGTEKGFEPNANISREQIATILYRYAKYIGLVGQNDAVSGDVSKFEDRESVSPWAQEAMAWAVEVGLFKGDDTNSLNPQGEATRAEVATLLERLIKLIVLS